jgi:putative toxin-antitoxin system antitoxin component (TIGR02293 family)
MSAQPLAEAYEKLKERRRQGQVSSESASSIRILAIRTLANRVFADEAKADVWLNRPNRSFSGQKPIDLLEDELGAAVVREALEQIDHGMFA